MGFVSDETLEAFTWFLSKFKAWIGITPSVIAMGQQVACMQAARTVFLSTYITLDEWHLNRNRLKNVLSHLHTIRRTIWANEMNADLFRMRRSSTAAHFFEWRGVFERKYFRNFCKELPVWF